MARVRHHDLPMGLPATARVGPLALRRGARVDADRLLLRVTRRIHIASMLAQLCGAIDVFVLLFWVLPVPDEAVLDELLVANLVALVVYLTLTSIVGWRLGRRMSLSSREWLTEDRAPTDRELRSVLRVPLKCTTMDLGFWLGAAVLFFCVNVTASVQAAFYVTSVILLGALTTCAVGYLLTDRLMRPLTARALAYGPPSRPARPGVKGRLVLAWLLATAVPLIGLIAVAIRALATGDISAERTAISSLALGGVALFAGALATIFAAKQVADPISTVRRALRRVEDGDFDTEVHVWDASEVGLLQSGFNRMAAGLREREELRDLFGRHVGEDVARAALDSGAALGGETREVGVLMVDLVGSTTLAETRPPEEVVSLLNRFFGVVVQVVGAHNGWVNKFEGDGAMCVFGVPVAQEDPAGCALSAARELCDRLADEVPEVRAGIGVSAGRAVAGNVGAERRFEYTVIGDPVNEAARLCELAKRRGERVLASHAAVDRARPEEAARWSNGEAVVLRGRSAETRLATPA